MSAIVEYDCIVVGAGIEGSATAYHLAKKKQRTLLLEQFGLPHTRGSSFGQSRLTRFSYRQKHYMQMMEEAFPLWSVLEKETKTTLFRNTQLLIIQKPPYNLLEGRKKQLMAFGKPHRELTHREVLQRCPGMRLTEDFRALLDECAGTLKANKALKGFQDEFKKRGGIIHDEEKVLSIIPGKIVTVCTNKNRYTSKSVVLTAGPWSSKILQPLGLNLPLETWRINVGYWRKKFGDFENFPCISDDSTGEKHIYVRPIHDYPDLVQVTFHNGPKCDPDCRDDVFAEDGEDIKIVKKFISDYLPGLDGSKPAILESCMYTVTPDWEFILDRHPSHSNIVIGCGFSGHGFKLAPVVGKILSELATGQRCSYDISPLSISRFGKEVHRKANL